MNAIKQAKEYKIDAGGQRLAALHAFITDVNSLGLPTAQGLIITSGFYWDATDGTRAWSRRFFAEHGRMPTREQAGVYVSVLHYLKAVQAAGRVDTAAIDLAMRKLPVDRFGATASVRADGRVIYDIGVYRVRTPARARGRGTITADLASVPGAVAYPAGARRRLHLRPAAGQPVTGPIRATIVGSLPKPGWLAVPGILQAPWKVPAADLPEALADGDDAAFASTARSPPVSTW